MSWNGADVNRGMWRTCRYCKERFTDWARHQKLHDVERPSDDHMTIHEVAAAIGRSYRTVFSWVERGWLPSLSWVKPPLTKARKFVHRDALKKFVANQMDGDLRKAITWAETGKVA